MWSMDVTLSIDDRTLARARQLALRRGVSLDEMIQNYLENLTASDPAQDVAELERLWSEEEGDSGGLEVEAGGTTRGSGVRDREASRPSATRTGDIFELAGTGLWEGDLSEMRALGNAGRRVDEAPRGLGVVTKQVSRLT
jgi:Family of unknown function (DUF6364)